MRPIRDRSSTTTWQSCCPISKLKSCGVPIRPKHSSYCQSAGSLNAPSHGSTAAAAWQRIGRTSIVRLSLSCASPQSASCCENSVIPLDVLGQTLSCQTNLNNVPMQMPVPVQTTRRITLLTQFELRIESSRDGLSPIPGEIIVPSLTKGTQYWLINAAVNTPPAKSRWLQITA